MRGGAGVAVVFTETSSVREVKGDILAAGQSRIQGCKVANYVDKKGDFSLKYAFYEDNVHR